MNSLPHSLQRPITHCCSILSLPALLPDNLSVIYEALGDKNYKRDPSLATFPPIVMTIFLTGVGAEQVRDYERHLVTLADATTCKLFSCHDTFQGL